MGAGRSHPRTITPTAFAATDSCTEALAALRFGRQATSGNSTFVKHDVQLQTPPFSSGADIVSHHGCIDHDLGAANSGHFHTALYVLGRLRMQ